MMEEYEAARGAPNKEKEGSNTRAAPLPTPEKEREGAPPDPLIRGWGTPQLPQMGGGVALRSTSIWEYFPKKVESPRLEHQTSMATTPPDPEDGIGMEGGVVTVDNKYEVDLMRGG